QDLIVVPQVQTQGIGSQIIQKLMAYVESLREEGSTMMLCLMCAKGREPFYEKHGFLARPTDALGPGMIQYLTDEN
ncbi:MAG: GNAT family N-acetyltransferase, partial [Lachnospiraceae bacterium]|nr:GNAT family N-acetyltransferase [Lachnospiraceae bacterium]